MIGDSGRNPSRPDIPSGKQTVCDIENGPVEIVDLPINSMVDLSIVMLGYQRVSNISIVLISSSIAAKISLSFSLLLRRILYRCWAIWLTSRKTLDDNNMQPRTPDRNTVVALSGDLNINQN